MEPRPRILIIDDEEVVLDSCTQILEGKGFELATAMNGEQGLRLVREFHPDLAFVDLKMPGLDGMEIIDAVKKIDEDIPVIIITAFASVESASEAIQKGGFDFIAKPFKPNDLRIVIERAAKQLRT